MASEVIASIAALAACEVEGVVGMDETAARHFGDWVRRQTAHRGVRVQVEADRSIHLEVFITVDSEAKLADVVTARIRISPHARGETATHRTNEAMSLCSTARQ